MKKWNQDIKDRIHDKNHRDFYYLLCSKHEITLRIDLMVHKGVASQVWRIHERIRNQIYEKIRMG